MGDEGRLLDREILVVRQATVSRCSVRRRFLAPPEHHEVRQREIDHEARADREHFRDQHRNEIGRHEHRDGIGDQPADLRRRERDVAT